MNAEKNKKGLTIAEKKRIRELRYLLSGSGKKKEVPTTAQKTIPFQKMYQNGICQVTPTYYTKMVEFFDVNYELLDEEKKIIPGLTKELLLSLLREEKQKKCICGHSIEEAERCQLEEWKSFFPPTSYKATYDKFRRNATKYAGRYTADKLYTYLRNMLQCKANIRELDRQIEGIDIDLKNCGDIDDLLQERNEKESEKTKLEGLIKANVAEISEAEHQLKIRLRKTSVFDNANSEVKKYQIRIDFWKKLYRH